MQLKIEVVMVFRLWEYEDEVWHLLASEHLVSLSICNKFLYVFGVVALYMFICVNLGVLSLV